MSYNGEMGEKYEKKKKEIILNLFDFQLVVKEKYFFIFLKKKDPSVFFGFLS